ncbi:MAG TPA: radical SAM family heme chaperone HemW [Phycisphaerales bacterium]
MPPPTHDTRISLPQQGARAGIGPGHPLRDPQAGLNAGPDAGGAQLGRGAHNAVRSLYIHVPFCAHKCHYCDFYSLVDTQDRQDAFTDRLIRELQALAPAATGLPLRTLFVGGGTPSLLRVDLWDRLLTAMARLFDLSDTHRGAAEFTVECNPESVTPALLDRLRAGGVNRVSMGAQSFEARHLRTLERRHDPENVARALEIARRAGIGRQSVDLIFGVPGQTLLEWETDLRRAVALGTEHVSCYNLTYEPNTAMTARLKRGEFSPADEDVEVEMYERTRSVLAEAGLRRYEISNYAKPGAEARHNLAYWRQEQWLAAGPSASGHVAGWRWKNAPRLDDYLNTPSADGLAPVTDVEAPDELRLVQETFWTGLRLGEGVDAGALLDRCEARKPGSRARLDRLRDRLVSRAQMTCDGDRWILTDSGMLHADGIAVEVMAAIDG